jgi:hypothetical protein
MGAFSSSRAWILAGAFMGRSTVVQTRRTAILAYRAAPRWGRNDFCNAGKAKTNGKMLIHANMFWQNDILTVESSTSLDKEHHIHATWAAA